MSPTAPITVRPIYIHDGANPEPTVHIIVSHPDIMNSGHELMRRSCGPERLIELASAFGNVTRRTVFMDTDAMQRTRMLTRWFEMGFDLSAELPNRAKVHGDPSNMANRLYRGDPDFRADILVIIAKDSITPATMRRLSELGMRTVLFKIGDVSRSVTRLCSHVLPLRRYLAGEQPQSPFQIQTSSYQQVESYISENDARGNLDRIQSADPVLAGVLRSLLRVKTEEHAFSLSQDPQFRATAQDGTKIFHAIILALASVPETSERYERLELNIDLFTLDCLERGISFYEWGIWALKILAESSLILAQESELYPGHQEFFFRRDCNAPVHRLARFVLSKMPAEAQDEKQDALEVCEEPSSSTREKATAEHPPPTMRKSYIRAAGS
ncbi:MAG: hypothetical protein NUV81_03785 [bacterium]|nr:hypothetical protein [bacterium]